MFCCCRRVLTCLLERLRSLQKINRPQPKGAKKKSNFTAKPNLPSSSTSASTSSPLKILDPGARPATSSYDRWVKKDADWGYSRREKKKEKVVWLNVGRRDIKLDADFSRAYLMSQPLRSRAFRILQRQGEMTKRNGFYRKVSKLRLVKMEVEEPRRPKQGRFTNFTHLRTNTSLKNAKAFAPPRNLNFAPPARYDSEPVRTSSPGKPADFDDPRPRSRGYSPPPRTYDDPTGEDAYLRRLRMSQQMGQGSGPSPPPVHTPSMLPRPPPSAPIGPRAHYPPNAYGVPLPPPPHGFAPPFPASQIPPPPPPGMYVPPPPPPDMYAPPPPPPSAATFTGASISREPVRYNNLDTLPTNERELERALEDFNDDVLAMIEADIEKEESQPAPRSTAPGQRGMAQRYMASKGWKEGQGLGAKRDGIKSAIRLVKARRSAAKNMGHAGMGRFVGGDDRGGRGGGRGGSYGGGRGSRR